MPAKARFQRTVLSRNAQNLVASLRGLPADSSKSFMREPKPLGVLVETLLQHHVQRQKPIESVLQQEWLSLVGATLAQKCRPSKIVGGRSLEILCANTVVRQELLFRKRDLLKNIQKLPGGSLILDLSVRNG